MLPDVLQGALGCKARRLREIARRLYTTPADTRELQAWGLDVGDVEGPPVEVWPSIVKTVKLFIDLRTQWLRAGMDGQRVGMNYEVLFRVMDRMGLDDAAWIEMWDDIRTLEDEALATMREASDG